MFNSVHDMLVYQVLGPGACLCLCSRVRGGYSFPVTLIPSFLGRTHGFGSTDAYIPSAGPWLKKRTPQCLMAVVLAMLCAGFISFLEICLTGFILVSFVYSKPHNVINFSRS